jgi:hypothetical protein
MKLRNQIATATGIILGPRRTQLMVANGLHWHLTHPQVVQLVGFCISRARVGKERDLRRKVFLSSRFIFRGLQVPISQNRPLDVTQAM